MKATMEQWNNGTIKNGMTLIEMLVVTAIMVILTGTFLFNYRAAQDQFALQRSANKLAQDIRRVEAMAMSAEEFPPGSSKTGYGIALSKVLPAQRKYFLYSDAGGDEFFQGEPPDIIKETVYLEEGVQIEDIYIDSKQKPKVSINFNPPDPEVKIRNVSTDDGSEVIIELALESDVSQKKRIIVNKLGLVTVE